MEDAQPNRDLYKAVLEKANRDIFLAELSALGWLLLNLLLTAAYLFAAYFLCSLLLQ